MNTWLERAQGSPGTAVARRQRSLWL